MHIPKASLLYNVPINLLPVNQSLYEISRASMLNSHRNTNFIVQSQLHAEAQPGFTEHIYEPL